jgi:hypothetical protein
VAEYTGQPAISGAQNQQNHDAKESDFKQLAMRRKKIPLTTYVRVERGCPQMRGAYRPSLCSPAIAWRGADAIQKTNHHLIWIIVEIR